jgi:hypothetical protein
MDSDVAAKMAKKKERHTKLKEQKKAPKKADSPWMAHVKAVLAAHPGMRLGAAMVLAKASYVKAVAK